MRKPNINEFIKVLKRGKSNYVPLAELGVHPKIKERFIGRPIVDLNDEVEFWYKAGYDYVKLQPSADFNPAKLGTAKVGMWATEGKGVITNDEEFENYTFPDSDDFDYSKFEQVKSRLPEGLGVIGQYGDIFTMTWEMMGFETFSFALFENPDLIKKLNNKIGNLVLSMFRKMAECDVVDVLWFSDDIAFTNSLLMSPEVLDTYFFPWLKEIGDLAKEYNKPLIYHSDGILYDVFDRIIECGIDAIHPIEPKAMEISEVKERYGKKLSIIGSVDVDLLARGTVEEVKKRALYNIENAGYNGGYILGSGNSIPDFVNFENYLALLKVAEEYKYLTD